MLTHPEFNVIAFEQVPLDRDLYIRDETILPEFEREWLEHINGKDADLHQWYITPVAARSIGADWMELSWYTNTFDRFHEVPIFLPRSAFVTGVDLWKYDEKPTIFVNHDWLIALHENPLAAYAMVDAIGIKDLIRTGKLLPAALRKLRDRIDEIADRNPNFAFISFADNLLVKQVWSVGHAGSATKYTYAPELLLPVLSELFVAFKSSIGVNAYAILTQGANAYGESAALHTSHSGNHISLNSLGLPFAQLMSIDAAARGALRKKEHEPAELYLDSTFFRSLRLHLSFDKNKFWRYGYRSPMTKALGPSYVRTNLAELLSSLR